MHTLRIDFRRRLPGATLILLAVLLTATTHYAHAKPGPVDTAMTWGTDKLPFLVQPDKVARDILKAADRKRDVLYAPIVWWPVMTVIRLIPERIFKKMEI